MRVKSVGQIQPRRTIFLMVEGASEEVYFNRVARIADHYSIVTKVSKDKSCLDIVRNCIKAASRIGLDEDDIKAVVFDLDVVDMSDLKEAVSLAEEKNVLVMVSNLSFELWLLMHLETVSRVYTQDDYESRLSTLLGRKYVKSKGIGDKLTTDSIKDAISRGKSIGVKNPIDC